MADSLCEPVSENAQVRPSEGDDTEAAPASGDAAASPESAGVEPIRETADEAPEPGNKAAHPLYSNRWADGTQRLHADGIARKHPKMATDTADVQQRLREDRDAIIADRGGAENLSRILISASGELAFVLFALDQWKAHFIDKGLTTRRGRVRSAYASYLSTLDRYIRLAQMVGLDRRPRRVPSPAEWLDSLPDRDEQLDASEPGGEDRR